jgi:DNA-binding CsgD family transcriptional regulator
MNITARQLEVLKSRFRHGSRKEGAASLGITDMTARWHLSALCKRLGVSNAEEAAYRLWLRDLWGEA